MFNTFCIDLIYFIFFYQTLNNLLGNFLKIIQNLNLNLNLYIKLNHDGINLNGNEIIR